MIQRRYFAVAFVLTLYLCGCESSDNQYDASILPVQSGSSGIVGWLGAGSGAFVQPQSEAGSVPVQPGGSSAATSENSAVSDGSGGAANQGGMLIMDAGPDGSSNPSVANSGLDRSINEDCRLVSEITVDILKNDIILEGQSVTKSVQTVLMVRWTQNSAADNVWLRFTFENDQWYESPKRPGTPGSHSELVLGVPEETDVTIQIVGQTVDGPIACETRGRTGSVPISVPRATVMSYDPNLASTNRWMFGSVENTPRQNSRYAGPFCIYIIDRQGRIVWYYLDQAWNPAMAYPRIAPGGTYVAIDRSIRHGTNTPSVIKTTLDFEYFEEYVTRDMTDSVDITDDGSLLYNSYEWLIEQRPDRTTRNIWNCERWAAETGANRVDSRYCYTNAVSWNPRGDSVILSFPYVNTAVEIDRQTGNLIGQWGDLPGSWRFDPPTRRIDFIHGGNITPSDTLLISSHAPGSGEVETPVPHFFYEFALDRVNRVATEIWSFGEGIDEWPRWKGEAFRVPGGNTLVNYGSGGTIREVTPGGQTAWHVKWDADFSSDYINKMVGHSTLIDDLYALCEGW